MCTGSVAHRRLRKILGRMGDVTTALVQVLNLHAEKKGRSG